MSNKENAKMEVETSGVEGVSNKPTLKIYFDYFLLHV